MFEHSYDKIVPWNGKSGNAIFVCIKKKMRYCANKPHKKSLDQYIDRGFICLTNNTMQCFKITALKKRYYLLFSAITMSAAASADASSSLRKFSLSRSFNSER